MSLKVKTISGVKWTTASTIFVTVLQLLQLAILVRFLSPVDFGLMAVVMVVMGFAGAFIDMGISNAIIHKQHITHNQLSSLYWLNVFVGFMMFGVVSASAPFVASFYHDDRLIELIVWIASTFIIQSFSQQFGVLWQKEMRFGEIAKIEIINKSFSFVVSVALAYQGYGVYSLVYASIAAATTQTLQYLYLGLKEHRPSLRFQAEDIRPFMSFGLYQMGERTVNYFNFQIDTILIGKLLGLEALGIYNIAKQIVMRPAQIFNPIVTKVTFPAMSKIQDDIPKLKEVYLKTINCLSSINFPVYAFIFVFAHEIVMIMFGAKWLEAVLIIQILSIWAAWRSTGNPIGSLLMARGRADLGFWWNLGLFFYVPFGVWISSHWGLVGVAIGLNAIMATLVYPGWKFLTNPLCGAGFVEYHAQILKPALVAIVAGVGAFLSVTFLDNIWIKFFVGGSVGLILTLVLNRYFNYEFLDELKGFVK
ncbi:MOP flippase family protein [Wolinella succinogenes]|uniref:MOP flippase family protein n=1 Tax=Wolinella succinogenes TaxID=844 RepID=UPI0024098F1E|nr:MOP flippase family protein [Wolinella succinogenes]